jgi:uncharacterized protein YggE
MLGLPKTTEIRRQLPKNAIFDRFKPSAADRQRFEADIRRLAIIHEVSAATVNIAAGENVAAFYVVLASLRSAECDRRNIALLSKLIDQNMLFVLEYDGKARLAAYRAGRVIQSGWKPLDEWVINLVGLNLDSVWDNIIVQIGGITVAEGNTLDEQIAADEERAKLLRRIEKLEQQARSEKQPRRKWELAEEVKKLKSCLHTAISEVQSDG